MKNTFVTIIHTDSDRPQLPDGYVMWRKFNNLSLSEVYDAVANIKDGDGEHLNTPDWIKIWERKQLEDLENGK